MSKDESLTFKYWIQNLKTVYPYTTIEEQKNVTKNTQLTFPKVKTLKLDGLNYYKHFLLKLNMKFFLNVVIN